MIISQSAHSNTHKTAVRGKQAAAEKFGCGLGLSAVADCSTSPSVVTSWPFKKSSPCGTSAGAGFDKSETFSSRKLPAPADVAREGVENSDWVFASSEVASASCCSWVGVVASSLYS